MKKVFFLTLSVISVVTSVYLTKLIVLAIIAFQEYGPSGVAPMSIFLTQLALNTVSLIGGSVSAVVAYKVSEQESYI